jgi:tetratricopeptide (TPR) repeat protein
MGRMARRSVCAAVVMAWALSVRHGRASPSADELVREAHAHEEAREDDVALRRYNEALAIDPTHPGAYLGLAAARLRIGDVREAVRVYDAALSHVSGLAAALRGRARARRSLGAIREADADLEAYVAATGDVEALRELSDWYGEEGRTPAQLGAWRRVLTRYESSGADDATLADARATVHALEVLVGTVDPVRAPPDGEHASRDRRGMAAIARRR